MISGLKKYTKTNAKETCKYYHLEVLIMTLNTSIPYAILPISKRFDSFLVLSNFLLKRDFCVMQLGFTQNNKLGVNNVLDPA